MTKLGVSACFQGYRLRMARPYRPTGYRLDKSSRMRIRRGAGGGGACSAGGNAIAPWGRGFCGFVGGLKKYRWGNVGACFKLGILDPRKEPPTRSRSLG